MRELSEKSAVHISRERHLELIHFIRQYPEWQEAVSDISLIRAAAGRNGSGVSDPVADAAERRLYYENLMSIVDDAARDTHEVLGRLIADSVIEGRSYDSVCTDTQVCCGRELWYKLYRRFIFNVHEARK